jgi:hypothetical protein
MVAEAEMTGVGLLADGQLLTWHPGRPGIEIIASDVESIDITGCYDIAIANKLNSFWLCPGSKASMNVNALPDHFAPAHLNERYRINVKRRAGDNVPQNASITPLRGDYGCKPRVYIMMPDHDPTWLEDQDNAGQSWAFSDVESPRAFMATLITIYQKFGVHLSTSPASTGIQTLRAKTPEANWKHAEGERDLPSGKPTQIYWHRKLFDNERGLYAHRGDKGGAFLAAATGAECGLGMADFIEGRGIWERWQKKLPGLWNVEIREPGHMGILRPNKAEWTGPRWLTTSGVRALEQLGYNIELYRAWTWENDKEKKIVRHRRVLNDWASWFWKPRQELREKYGKENPAARLAGMIYKRALGWLDLPLEDGEQPRWYHKPAWYHELQGLAQYRQALTISQMHKEYGIYPVLVYSDAGIWLSPEPDPRKAFPLLFQREGQLGGYKPDMTLQVDDEVIQAFDHAGPAQVLEHLKKIEASRGTHV